MSGIEFEQGLFGLSNMGIEFKTKGGNRENKRRSDEVKWQRWENIVYGGGIQTMTDVYPTPLSSGQEPKKQGSEWPSGEGNPSGGKPPTPGR